MYHLFIINPYAFKNRRGLRGALASKINHTLTRMQIPDDMFAVHVSRFPRDASGIVKARRAELPDDVPLRVYAVGGDGIVFDCLNGVVGQANTQLAVMPYVKRNILATSFGDSGLAVFRNLDLMVAADSTIPVDVIKIGNTYAISELNLGLKSAALFEVAALEETLSVFGSFLRQILMRRSYYLAERIAFLKGNETNRRYGVEIDGEDLSGKYANILIANAQPRHKAGHIKGALRGVSPTD